MHPGFRPFKHVPIFSMSRWSQSSDVGAVPLEQFHAYLENPPKWQEKKSDKLVWRGSTTGTWFYRDTPWRSSQRVRLHFLGNDVEGTAKVRFWEKSPVIDEDLGSIYGMEVNRTQLGRIYEVEVGRAELKERYTDIGFAGEVHQCPDEIMREAVKKYVHTLPRLSEYEQAGYKYVMVSRQVAPRSMSPQLSALYRRMSMAMHGAVAFTGCWDQILSFSRARYFQSGSSIWLLAREKTVRLLTDCFNMSMVPGISTGSSHGYSKSRLRLNV